MISPYFGLHDKLLRGFFHKKLNFHCEQASRVYTLLSAGFASADRVQSSNTDKKQAATRHSAPCGKLKCQTRKNLCIAYTQVNTHAHFFSPALCVFFFFSMKVFHTEDTHLCCEPPDMMTAKVHLINSWQAHARALVQEVEWLWSPDAIEATVPFHEKRIK